MQMLLDWKKVSRFYWMIKFRFRSLRNKSDNQIIAQIVQITFLKYRLFSSFNRDKIRLRRNISHLHHQVIVLQNIAQNLKSSWRVKTSKEPKKLRLKSVNSSQAKTHLLSRTSRLWAFLLQAIRQTFKNLQKLEVKKPLKWASHKNSNINNLSSNQLRFLLGFKKIRINIFKQKYQFSNLLIKDFKMSFLRIIKLRVISYKKFRKERKG